MLSRTLTFYFFYIDMQWKSRQSAYFDS